MGTVASQITSLTIVYSTVYSGADQRKHQRLKLRVTRLCAGNSPGTGEFPAQMASNAENVSIWWRHHEYVNLFSIPTHFAASFSGRHFRDSMMRFRQWWPHYLSDTFWQVHHLLSFMSQFGYIFRLRCNTTNLFFSIQCQCVDCQPNVGFR